MATINKSFLHRPISAQIFRSDDTLTRFQKRWLMLSEYIWSVPGLAGAEHNYSMIATKESPTLSKTQQVFAWDILAIATLYSRPLGLVLALATLAPKLIHRTIDVNMSKLRPTPLSFMSASVSCTYPGGKLGFNICDWAYMSISGFSMLFDGVGHHDPVIVEEQAFYLRMARGFEDFVGQFNYDQENAAETFLKEADQQVKNIHTNMLNYMESNYLSEDAENPGLAQKGTATLKALKQAITTNKCISRDQTLALLDMIKQEKAENFLRTLKTLKDPTDVDAVLIDCYEALCALFTNRDAALLQSFEEKVNSLMQSKDPASEPLNSQARTDFFAHLHHKHESLGRAGPAFGVSHIFQDEKQQRHLYLNRVADIGFLIIRPNEGKTEVNLSEFTADQCEWIPESGKSAGLGAEKDYYETGMLKDISTGTVVMDFTDGIGEFLTRDEIITALHRWSQNQKIPLTNAFKQAITTHQKENFDDKLDPERIKACADHAHISKENYPQERLYCKKYDPTGADSGAVDDIAVTLKIAH